MKEVKAFVCDFCPRKKRFAQRGTAARHESRCYYNPAMKACATCANFNYVPDYHEWDTGYSEGGPECAKDLLNKDPESATVLQNNCAGWEPKTAEIVSIKQIRIQPERAGKGDGKP